MLAYHVNGPALIKVGPIGTAGALSVLGYSVDGVAISMSRHVHEIMTDVAGSEMPAELQDMGMSARLRFDLVSYDLAVLQVLRSNIGAAGEGVLGPMGRLVGGSGIGQRVVISSPNGDEPWRFFSVFCKDAQEGKVGSKKTVWKMNMLAWCYVDPNRATTDGLKLFDHVDG